MEFGVKITSDDQKLVGTFSVFRLKRQNRNVDYSQKQFDEPLNWTGPNNSGSYNRIVRWYTASAIEQTEGLEAEVIWTPTRNWQTFISGAWMWDAETLADPSLDIVGNSSTATKIQNEITFSTRLVNAPEFRLNVLTNYTFTEPFLGDLGRGMRLVAGARYASVMNIQNNVNMWSARGGITAGDYVVFEAGVTYPFELFGYKLNARLHIDNLTDKVYSEGNFGLAPPRSYQFTIGATF